MTKARVENKPIFLSIGYASCHWCHVMERESFENEEIAALLNKYYVSIKVDREERPDIDHVYMTAATMMTGGGGWPLSVFLTPDLKPFFAGTYFPPDDRYGRPGFKRLVTELASIYHNDSNRVASVAEQVIQRLRASSALTGRHALPDHALLESAAQQLLRRYDGAFGGFGTGHKFPQPIQLCLLLRRFHATGDSTYWRPVEHTLTAMQQGGIYDHLAGGFHRYTVDRQWQIPHFEKMLYDNALLVMLYADAFQLSGDSSYLETVRRTLDFMLSEMRGEQGEFYSAIDADSEGKEGQFYIWSRDEIIRILGNRSAAFVKRYGVTESGNFEGDNILHLESESETSKSPEQNDASGFFAQCKEMLLAERNKRIRPLTDDKALTSWNGLALAALCRGFQMTGDTIYLATARRNAAFIQSTMFVDGNLFHSYREGQKGGQHFLEDYAYYLSGLIQLIQSDAKDADRWLRFAVSLADRAISLFLDSTGQLYLREANANGLIVRPSDVHDGATPSPGSVFIECLLKLNRLTENERYLQVAETCLKALGSTMSQTPSEMASALDALDYYLSDKTEVILVGSGRAREEMTLSAFSHYLPNGLVFSSNGGKSISPLLEGRSVGDKGVSAYVCVNSACLLPATTLGELKRQLDEL